MTLVVASGFLLAVAPFVLWPLLSRSRHRPDEEAKPFETSTYLASTSDE